MSEANIADQDQRANGAWLLFAVGSALVFALGYVLPMALDWHGALPVVGRTLSALISFVLLTVGLFRWLEARSEADEASVRHAARTKEQAGRVVRFEEVATTSSIPAPHPKQWSRELLHKVDWKCMLDLCQVFFEDRFRSQFGALEEDGTVQVHLFKPDDDSPAALVHCRVWGAHVVDLPAVERLQQTMAAERLGKGFFISYGGFTDEAKAAAQAKGITLIDEMMFFSMLNRLPEPRKQVLQAKLLGEDFTTPSCPVCGLKMKAGQPADGHHWGCRAYPKCKGVLSERQHGGRRA